MPGRIGVKFDRGKCIGSSKGHGRLVDNDRKKSPSHSYGRKEERRYGGRPEHLSEALVECVAKNGT